MEIKISAKKIVAELIFKFEIHENKAACVANLKNILS